MRNSMQERVLPGSTEAYAFATICVVLASVLRWGLGLIAQDILPLSTYYPAVLLRPLSAGLDPAFLLRC